LLQDIYSVVSQSNHDRLWLRNIHTEAIGLSAPASTCIDDNPYAPLEPLAQLCSDLSMSGYPTSAPVVDGTPRPQQSSRIGGASDATQASASSSGGKSHHHSSKLSVMAIIARVIVVLGSLVVVGLVGVHFSRFVSDPRNLTFTDPPTDDPNDVTKAMKVGFVLDSNMLQIDPRRYIQAREDSDHGSESSNSGTAGGDNPAGRTFTPISSIIGTPPVPSKFGFSGWGFGRFGSK
jgi:hypothetical protein